MTSDLSSRPANDGAADPARRHGTLQFTPGVAALGPSVVERVFVTLCVFDDFCRALDPNGQHHSGSLMIEGRTVVFAIEYRSTVPPHPTIPYSHRANRVITLRLWNE
jgi:hypothetical protein